MATYNYKRVYSLIVGKPPLSKPLPTQAYVPFTSSDAFQFTELYETNTDFKIEVPSRSVYISDLQMVADISSSSESSSDGDKATIKIYNLPDSERGIVQAIDSNIILKAGYESSIKDGNTSSLPIVFVGQVAYSKTHWEGADRVTTLNCKAGFTPATSVKISYTLPPLAPQYQTFSEVFYALGDIWKENGVSSVNMELSQTAWNDITAPSPLTQSIEYGWSYEGYLRDAMDDLCGMYNYVWYITNNNLYVHHKKFNKFASFIDLDENQTLEIQDEQDSSKAVDTKDTSKRVKIKLLLDGRIKDGYMLRIPFGEYKGTYSIKGRSYSLDYRGNDWYINLIAESI